MIYIDTILELWNGEIAPCEHCGAKDAQANLLYGKVQRGREAVEKVLPEEQRMLLEQHGQHWEDYLLRMMALAFREGFILGTRLGSEVFSSREGWDFSCKISGNGLP